MILRELFAKLGLDVDAQSFAKGQLAVEGIKFGLNKLVEFGEQAIDKIFDLVKETVELGRSSQATGIATRALQELQGAAEASGVDMESLNTSVFRLSRSILAAKKGTGDQADAFKRLGVHLKGADGKLKSTDEIMMDLADGFSRMPDSIEKTGLAMEIFGRGGARMIPMLNQGSAGLAKLRGEAVVLDEEAVKGGQRINKLLIVLHRMTKKFWDELLSKLLPAFEQILRWTIEFRIAMGGFVEFLIHNFAALGASLIGLGIYFDLLSFAAIKAAVSTAAAWIAAAAPFVAIAAVIAAVLLIFDDLRVYAAGGDSLFGRFEKQLGEWMKPKAGDPWFVAAIQMFLDFLDRADKAIAKFIYDITQTPEKLKQAFLNNPALKLLFKAGDFVGDAAAGGTPADATTVRGAYLPPPQIMGTPGGSSAVTNAPTFIINQSPGQSAQDVAAAIDQTFQKMWSDTNAAVGQ